MPSTSRRLPEQFANLERQVDDWALATMTARRARRLSTTDAERRDFYEAMTPRLNEALTYLNAFPLHDMPDDARNLLYLALTLAEISLTIEVYTPAFETRMAPNSRRVLVAREIDGL